MKLSRKQLQGLQLFQRPEVTTICFGGGAGGAKSTLLCFAAIYTCTNYPGIKWGLFRRTMSNMKKTLYPTMLEMLNLMGLIQDVDYYDRVMSYGTLTFKNGSIIEFNELEWRPSDPQMAYIGGREYTYAGIDEAGEIVEKAFNTVQSRIGRCKNEEYKLVPKLIITCNPSSNFLKDRFYKPYEMSQDETKTTEGYAMWEDGTYWDYETDSYKPAYSCFVRSTAFDNPFLDKNYIPTLMKQPPSERRRLLGGDWNFNSNEDSLFPVELLQKAMVYDLPEIEYKDIRDERGILTKNDVTSEKYKVPIFKKFIGVDVADKGKDRTVVSLIDNNVLVDQRVLDIGRIDPESPISRIYADKLEQYATNHGFTKNYAKNIWVEDNGVGAGLRDMMRTKGWAITAYTATAQKRSENYYQLYKDLDNLEINIYNKAEGIDELFRELGVHTYQTVNQKPVVVKKEKIKQELGRSPDLADSFMIANAARHLGSGFSLSDRFKVANPNH